MPTSLSEEQFAAMDTPHLVQRLVDSFTALADEVQNLTDRKTILEHKLRYAHEQVCATLARRSSTVFLCGCNAPVHCSNPNQSPT